MGHKEVTLAPVDEPDEVKVLYVTQESLPEGNYREVGFQLRKVGIHPTYITDTKIVKLRSLYMKHTNISFYDFYLSARD
jgi:hypothetical protein